MFSLLHPVVPTQASIKRLEATRQRLQSWAEGAWRERQGTEQRQARAWRVQQDVARCLATHDPPRSLAQALQKKKAELRSQERARMALYKAQLREMEARVSSRPYLFERVMQAGARRAIEHRFSQVLEALGIEEAGLWRQAGHQGPPSAGHFPHASTYNGKAGHRKCRGHGRAGERGAAEAEGGRRAKRERREDGHETATALKSGSGEALSLSIEETNKLRAKLGLKPLEVGTIKKEAGTKEDPMAADVINPMALRQREEIREKLAAAKEKRLLNQKLGKIKALGEDDPWLDDAAAWIERSRKLQQEKDLAEKRAKLLEEMDQEFGISSLVEEEFGQRKKDSYSSRDLQGLTVEHTIESFQEGETLVLTLKDKGVLVEEEDVLVNVNLVDKEKADKNVELRKKKPDYEPYSQDESVDDMAQAKPRVLLAKYDETLGGLRRPGFRLAAGGEADGTAQRELQQVREALRSQAQSLAGPGPRLAAEYLTPEEMSVTFRKPKQRVKRLRRKEKLLTAEDLLALGPAPSDHGDHGSRC
ncbi:U4/U6.U5 tri-snRNP-associated protein 1 isoform B [Alligator mississippiensis]|uniref:U4/U6.U5 tri-snRNP-associated protein 1 isoform B n=1 Tax=Alligator mississippiensis TaxID=8496 RepID=A0A151P546_ALLMI|nr:U4/U6.U5 tri-snRNP-associated protein 1 isoform B [Alligator mississippiensis]